MLILYIAESIVYTLVIWNIYTKTTPRAVTKQLKGDGEYEAMQLPLSSGPTPTITWTGNLKTITITISYL